MTDLGSKWDGSPATVRVVSRETTAPKTVLGPPAMRDVTPGYRQYDIQYPPPAEPGRPRGHPQSANASYGVPGGSGYVYDRAPRLARTVADTIGELERRVQRLDERLAALEAKDR
jgi:hypothetical protein